MRLLLNAAPLGDSPRTPFTYPNKKGGASRAASLGFRLAKSTFFAAASAAAGAGAGAGKHVLVAVARSIRMGAGRIGIANPADLPEDVGLPKNAVIGREYVRGNRKEPGDPGDPSSQG